MASLFSKDLEPFVEWARNPEGPYANYYVWGHLECADPFARTIFAQLQGPLGAAAKNPGIDYGLVGVLMPRVPFVFPLISPQVVVFLSGDPSDPGNRAYVRCQFTITPGNAESHVASDFRDVGFTWEKIPSARTAQDLPIAVSLLWLHNSVYYRLRVGKSTQPKTSATEVSAGDDWLFNPNDASGQKVPPPP